jgi:glycine cleavage system H protein
MYYTRDHEWIDFRGTCAYIGISKFKLIGFREIHEIIFNDPINYKKKGEVIAWIGYKDYKIELLMPINGSIVQINKVFSNKKLKSISDHLEKSGWIFTVIPANPYDRAGLIPIKDYMPMIRAQYPK